MELGDVRLLLTAPGWRHEAWKYLFLSSPAVLPGSACAEDPLL